MDSGHYAPKSAASATPRILIAHPHKAYLGVIAHRLAESGFRLCATQSVQAAVAELYRLPVDLVLAELKSPGFCGRELVSIIRGDAVLGDIPVLLFAGKSDPTASVEALCCGADGVVRKPFHFEVLVARLHRELDRRRAVEELRHDNRALDARIIARAFELGELRARLHDTEAECRRLTALALGPARQ